MAHVPAVVALVAVAGDEEFVAERAEDDLEKLLLDELVAVHLVDLALALLDGTLSTETTETSLHRSPTQVLLDWKSREGASQRRRCKRIKSTTNEETDRSRDAG